MVAHGWDATLVARLLFVPTYKRAGEFEPHRHALHTGLGAWQEFSLGALRDLGRGKSFRLVRSEVWGGAKVSAWCTPESGARQDSRVVHSGASIAAVFFAWCTRFRATVNQSRIPAQRNRTQRTERRFSPGAIRRTAPAVKLRRVPNPAVHHAKYLTLRAYSPASSTESMSCGASAATVALLSITLSEVTR